MLQRNLKLIQNVLVLLILSIFLTNCSGVKKLSIFKEEVPRQKLDLPKPSPLQLEQIKWIIITSENAEEVFKKMEEQGLDPVLLKITNDLLDKYKEYYESDKDNK
jgi:hypothetical protein